MKITVTDHILEMLAEAFENHTGLNPYATDDDTLIAIARHFDSISVPDDYFIRLRDYYQTSKK